MSGAPGTLPAALQLKPLRQGDHDGLCCVYSAINAIRLVLHPGHKLTRAHTKALFGKGIRLIDERGSLLNVLRAGMEEALWIELCTNLVIEAGRLTGALIKPHFLLDTCPKPSSRAAVGRIRRALKNEHPVLVLLLGAYDHCTVVAGITDERLILFDSSGFKWVSLSNVGLMHPASARIHQIPTTSAISLSIAPVEQVGDARW